MVMPQNVIPIKRPINWRKLRPDEAERIIKERASITSNVIITYHARERVEERSILQSDLYQILREGYVDEAPEKDVSGSYKEENAWGQGGSRSNRDDKRDRKYYRRNRNVGGSKMTNKAHHYRECGLDYVYLLNGFKIHEKPYGKGVSIQFADELHAAIAREIVTSPRPIRGQEARYLRSLLDLSQADLARTIGTTRISITRWEGKPNQALPGTADTALRLIYTNHADAGSLIKRTMDVLRERDDAAHGKKALPNKITLRARGGDWDTARVA